MEIERSRCGAKCRSLADVVLYISTPFCLHWTDCREVACVHAFKSNCSISTWRTKKCFTIQMCERKKRKSWQEGKNKTVHYCSKFIHLITVNWNRFSMLNKSQLVPTVMRLNLANSMNHRLSWSNECPSCSLLLFWKDFWKGTRTSFAVVSSRVLALLESAVSVEQMPKVFFDNFSCVFGWAQTIKQ